MKTQEAIDHYGSATKLAAELDVSAQAVQAWGEAPPIPRQYQIQVLTKGKLKADK